MAGEMRAHLGYRTGEGKPAQQADERNGVSAKTLLTGFAPVLPDTESPLG